MSIKMLRRVAFASAVGFYALPLFGQQAGVELPKQTTYITAPLAEDGLPNYALAFLERQREGITRENNGARLFWSAIGPSSVTPEQYALLCKELGVEESTSAHLVDVSGKEMMNRLAEWLHDQGAGDATAPKEGFDPSEKQIDEAKKLLEMAYELPWAAERCPPLADWLAKNDGTLDILAEAAAKPRFYSPMYWPIPKRQSSRWSFRTYKKLAAPLDRWQSAP